MHFTPRPRWLRIVSMAIVVLPVLRSPMISSRWPRPTGVMASMALMPVCSGSCTGLRPMMPGAWISMRRSCTPTRGPLPSTGLPSASTTRPSRPSPTGTDRMRPVALTVSPSLTAAASPSTTAPIESSSRFLRSAEAMSAVLMVSSAIVVSSSSRLLEGVLELVETAAHRPVDDGIADLGDDAAQDRRVDHDLDLDLLAGGLAEGLGQALALVVVQVDRRAHLGDLLVGFCRAHLDELPDDVRQVAGSAGADDQ